MHLLLFVVYGLILCYLLNRLRFFRDSGLKPRILILLFGLRVAAGCLHDLVAWRFYPNHGDIWAFFNASFITRYELFHDFHLFIADNATWAYLPYNVIIFLHVLFNFLSLDNMYINTLFFSFIVFAGSIALFRAVRGLLRNDLLSAALFLLIPSTLYWTACIHKEGLIWVSLGFFFYHLQGALSGGWNTKRIVLCLLFFCMTAFFRLAIALTLLTGLLLWILIPGKPSPGKSPSPPGPVPGPPPRRRIGPGLLGALAIIAIITIVKPAAFSGILSYVSGQQMEFQVLHGNSRIYLPVLEPTVNSFLHILPTALFNGFLQPLPGSGGQSIYLVFSIELILIWLVVLWGLISLLRPGPLRPGDVPIQSPARRLREGSQPSPPRPPVPNPRPAHLKTLATQPAPGSPRPTGFLLCCLLFAASGLLLIGYIIPFAGAIIRYRSLYLPFLLLPFVHILHRSPFFAGLNDRLNRLLLNKWD